MSYLHQYINNIKDWRNTTRGRYTRALLEYFIIMNYDYNPFFYYMEALAGRPDQNFPHVSGFTETILQLHTMNETHFLATGEIIVDESLEQAYASEHDVSCLNDLRFRRNEMLRSSKLPLLPSGMIQATYICLLKIGILQQSKRTFEYKFRSTIEFCKKELGVFMLREVLIAALYFSGRIGKLIPIGRGAGSKVLGRVRSSAWDILLLRLPEFLLCQGNQKGTTLAFICTADKALHMASSVIAISSVRSLAAEGFTVKAELEIDADRLMQHLGAESTSVVMKTLSEGMLDHSVAVRRDEETLNELAAKLERQALQICQA